MAGQAEIEIADDEEDILELPENQDDNPEVAEDDHEIPTFSDDSEDQDDDTPRMRQLRATLRETLADKKRLEQERPSVAKPKIELGVKPTLEACEYDEDKFERELTGWHDRKRSIEDAGKEQQAAVAKQNEDLARVVNGYEAKKAALPYADKADMEAVAMAGLSDAQREIIFRTAADPAKLMYALGRNAAKLGVLSSLKVTDVVSAVAFASAATKIDGELKMAKRRPTAAPDKPVRGSASMVPTNFDKRLEAAEKEAEKTGDRTKVIAIKREMKEKAK